MEKNGAVVASGVGAAMVENPAMAVAMLANELAKRGLRTPGGTVILSGGVTEAIPVKAGDSVVCRVQGIGNTSIKFV